jgi:hypothetical protein
VAIGTANAEGDSANYVRGNHVHAHGDQTVGSLHAAATTTVAGFLSSTDKTHLNACVEGPASAVVGNLATFANVSGKVVADSGTKPADFAPAAQGVTNGNSHDHDGGDGAQVDHTKLGNIGTNTHGTIDLFLASKGAASGLASLDSSSKVSQNPSSATTTPTAAGIPIADGTGKLAAGWLPAGSTQTKSVVAVFGDAYNVASVAAGLTCYAVVPYAGTLTGWRLIANAACTLVVDVWKAAGAIPTVANAISGSGDPSLTGATVASGNVTGWTTAAVSVGDVFGFNLVSLSGTPTEVQLVVEMTL